MEKWRFRGNWFLRYVWGTNFILILRDLFGEELLKKVIWPFKKVKPDEPKSICDLVWGSILGIIATIIFSPLMFFFVAFLNGFIAGVICLIYIVAGFVGYYSIKDGIFGPYKYWGVKRIPVAPWEICAAGGFAYLLIYNGSTIFDGVYWLFGNQIFLSLSTPPILFLAALYFLYRTIPGKVFREYLKVKAKKMGPCPLIEIVWEEEKR